MTQHESQKSIRLWATSTFGSSGSTLTRLTRTEKEVAELLDEVVKATLAKRSTIGGFDDEEMRNRIAGEVADVAILVLDTAEAAGHALIWSADVPFFMANCRSILERVGAIGEAVSKEVARAISAHESPALDNDLRIYALNAMMNDLASIAVQIGTNLQAIIDLKMAVNRSRFWKIDAIGNGAHVKGAGNAKPFSIALANDHTWARAATSPLPHLTAGFAKREKEFEARRTAEKPSPLSAEIADKVIAANHFCGCGAGGIV